MTPFDDQEQADLLVVPGYKVSSSAKQKPSAAVEEPADLMVVAGFRVTDE
jgi:hypothetical protein